MDDPRTELRALLSRFETRSPERRDEIDRFRDFATRRPDCLERSCEIGHITASSWILSKDHERALLTHHRKLDRWLQLGGHVDGDPMIHEAALREAREESGFAALELVRIGGEVVPLDLDVHPIPARGDEPQHDHWDVRFLIVATHDEPVVVSEESHDVRWFDRRAIGEVTEEESVLRLERLTESFLRASGAKRSSAG